MKVLSSSYVNPSKKGFTITSWKEGCLSRSLITYPLPLIKQVHISTHDNFPFNILQKELLLKYTLTPWEFRQRLRDDKDETLLSVFTAWELSYQQISMNKEEREMGGHLLTLSAFSDASNVGKDIFKLSFSPTNQTPQWMEHFTVQGVWDQYKTWTCWKNFRVYLYYR